MFVSTVRTPVTRRTTRLFNYLTEKADLAQQRYPTAELVFLGDYNAHHKEWLFPFEKTDHAGREARNFALALDLTQLVNVATRVPDVDSHTPNCLDLVLATEPDCYSVSVSAPLGTSDHCLVKAVCTHSPPDETLSGTRRVWRYGSADWDEMRHFFAAFPWRQVCFSSDDPTTCANAVVDVIRQGMEYFIPFSDLSPGYKARPWYNSDCARAEMRKETAYQAWVQARDRKASPRRIRSKKRAYNAATRSFKRVLQRARFDHVGRIGSRLASYPPGSKQFWSLSRSVESNFCRPSLPPMQRPDGSLAHSATEKANLFASLFANNSRLDAGLSAPPTLPRCDSSMPEVTIHLREVRKALCSLDVNKASGPDGIPARVLRLCAPELSPVLTRLYRLSLEQRTVPKSWKLANVQPVPKKGSRADPANYRPIAITSIICKVMERVLNSKLLTYLETNDLLCDHQYGFRRGRSTGDLLVYVTHYWGEAIEKHGEALAVSLDISKAFDRVWHAGLLSKLPAYGIPAGFSTWISDFLSERSIRVVIDGGSSDLIAIDAGVPQGSVLSATLFLLHINDLLMSGIVGYADDSTVLERYVSGAAATAEVVRSLREDLVERTDEILKHVSQWGDKNLVTFNSSKTQACLFTAKKSPFNRTPTFRGASVPITDRLELLGMELTSRLNFGTTIESKAQTAAKKLGILNRVKRYFSPGQLLTLYKAQVRSCMEYCSHLWDGSAKYQLAALDSVERRAKRLIGDRKLVEAKLHSLDHRRKVACLSVFYRLYFGECAQELHRLIPPSPFHLRKSRRTEVQADENIKDAFYVNLTQALEYADKNIIVMGDFNGQTGKQRLGEENILGKHGSGERAHKEKQPSRSTNTPNEPKHKVQEYYDKQIKSLYTQKQTPKLKKEPLSTTTTQLIQKRKELFGSQKNKETRKAITKISKEISKSIKKDKNKRQLDCINKHVTTTGGIKKALKELNEFKTCIPKLKDKNKQPEEIPSSTRQQPFSRNYTQAEIHTTQSTQTRQMKKKKPLHIS
ncbi:uncharacterized protein LOC126381362 [Pectinophora gossypiella]|uniref:uncharacterized protein LOC126381362 n=1 Tax=Pectinophora gossypiella TaxID=13191 RepID=UPI00214EBF6D|nr:uncharacterized protein LOC126381362 [Pectinophora gossypiella]